MFFTFIFLSLLCDILLLSFFFFEYLCSSSDVEVLFFGLILLRSPESSIVSLLFVTEELSFVMTTIFVVPLLYVYF